MKAARRDDLIILVHGTFPPSREKYGAEWWQLRPRESAPDTAAGDPEDRECFTAYLAAELFDAAGSAAGVESLEPFLWTGENREQDREEAGGRLLSRLLDLERQGRPYHLIGHSHGGSVIWAALRKTAGAAGAKSLSHLRSWATVGTPFLRFDAEPFPGKYVLPVFALAAYAASAAQSLPTSETLSALYANRGAWPWAGYMALWAILAVMGFWLLWQTFRWLLAFRAGAASGAAEKAAFERYGPRWCGLVSDQDEAVSGLAGTLGFDKSLSWKPKLPGWCALLQPALDLADRAVLEPLFRGPLDHHLRERMMRMLQGNDLGTYRLTRVGSHPLGQETCSPLDTTCDAALIARSNKDVGERAETLRLVFTRMSFDPSVSNFFSAASKAISGSRLLVHSTYFDEPRVRELLKQHIEQGCRGAFDGLPERSPPPPALIRHRGVFLDRIAARRPLVSLQAVFLLLLAGAICLSQNQMWAGTVRPVTNEFQVRRALVSPLDRWAANNGSFEPVADWLLTLAEAGCGERAERKLARLPLPEDRTAGAAPGVDKAALRKQIAAANPKDYPLFRYAPVRALAVSDVAALEREYRHAADVETADRSEKLAAVALAWADRGAYARAVEAAAECEVIGHRLMVDTAIVRHYHRRKPGKVRRISRSLAGADSL